LGLKKPVISATGGTREKKKRVRERIATLKTAGKESRYYRGKWWSGKTQQREGVTNGRPKTKTTPGKQKTRTEWGKMLTWVKKGPSRSNRTKKKERRR